jgi:hypothetical protein
MAAGGGGWLWGLSLVEWLVLSNCQLSFCKQEVAVDAVEEFPSKLLAGCFRWEDGRGAISEFGGWHSNTKTTISTTKTCSDAVSGASRLTGFRGHVISTKRQSSNGPTSDCRCFQGNGHQRIEVVDHIHTTRGVARYLRAVIGMSQRRRPLF